MGFRQKTTVVGCRRITSVTGGLEMVMEHNSLGFLMEKKSGMENNSWENYSGHDSRWHQTENDSHGHQIEYDGGRLYMESDNGELRWRTTVVDSQTYNNSSWLQSYNNSGA